MKTATILIVLCLLASAAQGVELSPEAEQRVQGYIAGTGTITDQFDAPGDLIGLAIEISPGQGVIAYTDASANFLLSGALVDLDSLHNHAAKAQEQYFPGPGVTEMYEQAGDLHYAVTNPGGGNPIYIISDLQCPYTERVAQSVRSHGIENEVRWILVGWQSARSSQLAATVMEMESPQDGGRAILAHLDGSRPLQGAERAGKGTQRLRQNEAFAESWGLEGTPQVILPARGQLHHLRGLPPESVWGTIKAETRDTK